MKRLFVVFFSTIAMVMAMLVVSSPAEAYVTGKKCMSYRDVVTCIEPEWRKQADGTGVYLEGFWMDTTQGCSSLEDSGGKYSEVGSLWVRTANDAVWRSWDWGTEPCNIYHDLEEAGADTGDMDFRWSGKARIDWATDKKLAIGFTLKTNGSYTVNYKLMYDA